MKKLYLPLTLLSVIFLFIFSCKQSKPSKKQIIQVDKNNDASPDSVIFKTIFTVGEVKVTKDDGTVIKLSIDDLLTSNDTIITGQKATANLQYKDRGVIRISENTTCVLSTISKADSDSSKIKLNEGKVSATFGKLKKERFIVETSTIVAAVRGTSFVVTANDQKSEVSVAKGTVAVSPVTTVNDVDEKIETNTEIETSVSAGEKAVVLNSDIDKNNDKTKSITAEPMTSKDLKQIKKDISAISVEKAPDIAPEVKTEIFHEVPEEIDKAEDKLQKIEQLQIEEEAAAIAAKKKLQKKEALKKKIEQQKKEEAALKKENEEQVKQSKTDNDTVITEQTANKESDSENDQNSNENSAVLIPAEEEANKNELSDEVLQQKPEQQTKTSKVDEDTPAENISSDDVTENTTSKTADKKALNDLSESIPDSSDKVALPESTLDTETQIALNITPEVEPEPIEEQFDEIIEFDSKNAKDHQSILTDTSNKQKRKGAPKTEIKAQRKTKIKPLDFSAKYGISVETWGELVSMDTDDWIEYTVIIPQEGDYNVVCNITSFQERGSIELITDENSSTISIPSTISGGIGGVLPVKKGKLIHMKKGEQTIRLRISRGGAFTINYLSIKKKGPFTFGDLLDLFSVNFFRLTFRRWV